MSNPIASLKKSRKAPLHLPEMPNQFTSPIPPLGDPPRRNYSRLSNLSEFEASVLSPFHNSNPNVPDKSTIGRINLNSSRQSVPVRPGDKDSELLDEVTSRMAERNYTKNTNSLAKPSNNSPSDLDLMQVMMKKLKFYEAKCQFHENQLKEKVKFKYPSLDNFYHLKLLKEKRIQVLEEKNKLYEKAQLNKTDDYVSDLECKYLLLQEKVYEMEKFFADYGLTWVGEISNNEASNELSQDLNLNSNSNDFKCDYNLIVENIKELNALAREGEQKIVENSHRATFKPAVSESVRLVLYENGIMLFNGPFRSFNDAKTQRFCQDIMDGYFPSELQRRYPDGVPFEVIDKREVHFEDKLNRIIENKGYRLGDRVENNDSSYETDDMPKLTIDEFLKKLPSSVIKNGNIISIRGDLEDKLKGKEIQTDDIIEVKSEIKDDSQLISLKIKSENGKTIMINVKPSDTIKNVKKIIRNQLWDLNIPLLMSQN